MPVLISKVDAVKRLENEARSHDCLMCSLNLDSKRIVFEDDHSFVFLSAYPRYWGHTIISLKRHAEIVSELDENEYFSIFSNARKVAVFIEQELKPSRTYIAAIGSEINRLNTCPHFHVNVIPVYDTEIKPSQVFTWENGIYDGTETEWEELFFRFYAALNA